MYRIDLVMLHGEFSFIDYIKEQMLEQSAESAR